MNQNRLTWALVIPTYKREHILPRCLRLAAQQTRLPSEIIVVDASPDWEKTRDQILNEFVNHYPEIRLFYVKATLPSSTAQRNQGIDLATADVLFLIDDDSLMYPNCAEEVMKVYEIDKEKLVMGVGCIGVPTPPDAIPSPHLERTTIPQLPKQRIFRNLIKRFVGVEQTYFLPYDTISPAMPLPETLSEVNAARIHVMAGYAMTFRRAVLLKERFSEVLQRYAAGEDQDLSYRVSRHGALVNAINARLCHLEISGGRLSLYTVTVLAALNPAVLQQIYASEIDQIQIQWKKILRKRILIGFYKDVLGRKLDFPRARGVIYALSQLHHIHSKSADELANWYPKFQANLISKN